VDSGANNHTGPPHLASNLFEPGTYVMLPGAPDWGLGQVQCVVGTHVTVNFENAGKRLINVANAELRPVTLEEAAQREHPAP
jgi:Protein of unknown function (DUF3553)